METWKESDIVYAGTVVRLRVGAVELDNGTRAHREVVEHPGGVCVIPYDGKSVYLVRQYRIAVGEYVLEGPAGKLEEGDVLEERARLELREETGYTAGQMHYVGFIYGTVGFCSEKIHLYLALDLQPGSQQLEEEERIKVLEIPLEEIRQGLAEHRYVDGKTVVGLQALLHHLELNSDR